jgi:hypothetical protein
MIKPELLILRDTLPRRAARLKEALDLDSIRGDLTAVVQTTLEPAHVSVWIRALEGTSDRNQ